MDCRRAVWQADHVRTRPLIAAGVMALVLAGCSGSADAGDVRLIPKPRATPDGTGVVTEIVRTELTSEARDLHTTGPDGRRVFGWNLLTGRSTFLSDPVEVRLQGSVEYTDGSGPFDGFLRIIAEDGSELDLYVDGQSTAGDPTDLTGRMDFIGATGRYADMVAVGDFVATRDAAVGSPVKTELVLTIDTDGVATVDGTSPTASPSALSSASSRGSASAAPQ